MNGTSNPLNDLLKDAKRRKRKRLLKKIFSFPGFVVFSIILLISLTFVDKKVAVQAEAIDKKGTFSFAYIYETIAAKARELLQIKANINPGFLKNEGKITRRTRLGDIYAQYNYSVIYRGNVRIAEFKEADGKVYDFKGEIPDGEAEFFDISMGTYGVEYYKNNRREGGYFEYFQGSNKLRLRGLYYKGKLMSGKEYYLDGTLRNEYAKFEKIPAQPL